MWRRFADPQGLLRTYSLADAIDFIHFLIERTDEDLLWETWLHRKPTKGSGDKMEYLTFDEFKRSTQTYRRTAVQTVTTEEEQKRVEFASQYIKIRKEAIDGTS